jgi:hypothetical protein
MFTLDDYRAGNTLTKQEEENANKLIVKCTALEKYMISHGVKFLINPKTKTIISGNGAGGYRWPKCTVGAEHSAHRECLAVDIFDPDNEIDAFLASHPMALYEYQIYIEHPDFTKSWSHWSIRVPPSGKHIFIPK